MSTKISQLTALTAAQAASSDKVPVLDVSVPKMKAMTVAELRKLVNAWGYVATITQSGTGNPSATVLSSALSAAIVWTRTSAGIYVGTLAGAFPAGTVVHPHGRDSSTNLPLVMDGYRLTDDTVQLRTFEQDGWTATVTIEVYQ